VIRYHGTPITPAAAATQVLRGRHALVSFANPCQINLVAEVCQSFVLDNGAFTAWTKGVKPDWDAFTFWANDWVRHPGFDWLLIPDVIDGSEEENRKLVWWFKDRFDIWQMCPVWHLHESIEWLIELSKTFPRVALGSSGKYAKLKTEAWEQRMNEAFDAITDEQGRPSVKVHGLRMMDPTIFSRYPFSSVDSANVARNMGIDKNWENNPYLAKVHRAIRGVLMADRCETHAAASVWIRSRQKQYDLLLG
jgi:hypothetical protein